MKKLTVILMVLALVFTSVFAQGAAEGAGSTGLSKRADLRYSLYPGRNP